MHACMHACMYLEVSVLISIPVQLDQRLWPKLKKTSRLLTGPYGFSNGCSLRGCSSGFSGRVKLGLQRDSCIDNDMTAAVEFLFGKTSDDFVERCAATS